MGAIVLTIASLVAGCEGTAPPPQPPPDQQGLLEVGEMYIMHVKANQKPPQGKKDVDRYATAFSYGSLGVQRGDLMVFWGADLVPDSQAVLAYEKNVPKAGGAVLLQDGVTVKAMTAEEFQAAPKADGKLDEPGKARKAR